MVTDGGDARPGHPGGAAPTGYSASGQPASGQPASGQPVSGQPVSGQRASGQPVSGQRASGQPVSGQRASGQPSGSALLRLVEVMDRLRTGCPWDAEQTHESLAPHLIEESYEALEALESGDSFALRDELGDVLLQVVFHARIAAERSDSTGFTIDDVAEHIVAKLVRRHPHVFGNVTVSGPEEVKRNWDAIKAAERAERDRRDAAGNGPAGPAAGSGGSLDSVPFGQPALALAAQLQRRAERAGAPPELADLGTARSADERVSEIGAELFALVARARAAGIDPELELREASRRYRERVRDWERVGREG